MTGTTDFASYAQSFVDGLIDGGITHVVICPGSRSTPLAIAFAKRAGDVRQWALYDERSAGFFALGIAKSSSSPVALVCTSGTAAANLLPAVAEASLGRVPMVVVTADRPPESRDFGGAQTIDQVGLFSSHVKWFQDMPVAADLEDLLRYSRRVGARASYEARLSPGGPVHVNFSFREPLVSGTSSESGDETRKSGKVTVVAATSIADDEQVRRVAKRLRTVTRGVVIAGPGEYGAPLRKGLERLSERLGWPILADVLSNLRQDRSLESCLVRSYELLVRNQDFKANRPDCIIRLGGVPTSKELNSFCKASETILLDDGNGWRDPEFGASTMIFGELDHTVAVMNRELEDKARRDADWLKMWLRADADAEASMETMMEKTDEPFEGKLFQTLSTSLAPSKPLTVVVGNSMPVRDLEYFFSRGSENIRFVANRGANGIDGVVSTAMGISASEGEVHVDTG